MKSGMILSLGMVFSMANTEPAHVRNTFEFIVHAPMSRAAALFGPDGERCWAGPRWNPEFLYPQPGKDVEGAVFRVQHGPHKSVWVNTLFDLTGGRMQYVAFIPDVVITTVDVSLTPLDPSSTKVDVVYARTAVDAAANENVEAMGKKDRESGPEWQQAINACLSKRF